MTPRSTMCGDGELPPRMPTLLTMVALLAGALADDAGYQKGRSLYEAFEYEQALLRFQTLSARADLPAPERAEVLLWVALCLDGVGRTGDADGAMRDAVRLYPEVALPTSASPQVEQRFQAAVSAVRAELAKRGPDPPVPPAVATPPLGPGGLVIGLGIGSAVALLGSAALGVVAAERWGASTDPQRYVDERAAAHGVFAWSLAGALVSGLVGAGLAAGTAFVLMSPGEPADAVATGTGG